MLITEWNTEEAKEVWFEEGWEEGREEGLEKGQEKGQQQVLEWFDQGLTVEEIKRRLAGTHTGN